MDRVDGVEITAGEVVHELRVAVGNPNGELVGQVLEHLGGDAVGLDRVDIAAGVDKAVLADAVDDASADVWSNLDDTITGVRGQFR